MMSLLILNDKHIAPSLAPKTQAIMTPHERKEMFKAVRKEAHQLRDGDKFRIFGQIATVLVVTRIGEWLSIEFKMSDSVIDSAVIVANCLSVEVLVKE